MSARKTPARVVSGEGWTNEPTALERHRAELVTLEADWLAGQRELARELPTMFACELRERATALGDKRKAVLAKRAIVRRLESDERRRAQASKGATS